MIIFLHNSRCSKSREALKIMSDSKKGFTLREYLKNPLDFEELQDLQEKLWKKAIEFTRMNENEFKTSWLNKDSSDQQILKAMAKYPKLMQRPIIFNEKKAVIFKTAGSISELFKR